MADLFSKDAPRKSVIGVIHLPPLPGAPRYDGSFQSLRRRAVDEAKLFEDSGLQGIIVENYNDNPFYPVSVPAETVASMSVVTSEICARVKLPVGVNVLRNDAVSALAIAEVCGAKFIRINVHVSAYVTDQGVIQGRAHETLRQRATLNSSVKLFCDVRVKHASPLGRRDLADEASDLELRGCADALIVTGTATGKSADAGELQTVSRQSRVPVFVGSGANPSNLAEFFPHASGFIVGTYFRNNGILDETKIMTFMKKVEELQKR